MFSMRSNKNPAVRVPMLLFNMKRFTTSEYFIPRKSKA